MQRAGKLQSRATPRDLDRKQTACGVQWHQGRWGRRRRGWAGVLVAGLRTQVYQRKMLEAITQATEYEHRYAHVSALSCVSGCSTVRSMAATLLCWGGSAEDMRMSFLLLVSKRLGSRVSRGKSHFPENIWQPIGGKLQRNLFLPGMLLLFGNKDLIF